MPHSVHPTPRSNTPDQNDLSTQYWNTNIPKSRWTKECPEFLQGQSEKNIGLLGTKDEYFSTFSWEEAQELVRTNKIHHFHRGSSSLRAYLEYIHQLKLKHGSVLAFIQQERLHWENVIPSGDKHFTNAADFKVVYNDWPYMIDRDITHLIVWTKWQMEDKADGEEVTDETRSEIEEFITNTFCSPQPGINGHMNRDQIIWFKNWKSLKSVHALGKHSRLCQPGLEYVEADRGTEHVHIMLYRAPRDLLEAVTGGDRPISESWTGSNSE